MRRFLTGKTAIGAAILAVVAAVLAAVASAGTSPVTKARLERSLPESFARLYVQQAAILGHRGITEASLHARASCDKGGPNVADHGPGSDWICQMAWDDPNVPLPDGSAKFELNVHANGCYTAGGPSKYIGQLTVTDAHGKEVDNPVFEWDGCFDPHGDDRPTGVDLKKPASSSLTPTQQAAQTASVTLPTGTMAANADGTVTPTLTCSPGKDGCAGQLTATLGGKTVTTDYVVAPDDHQPVTIQLPRGATGVVRLSVAPVIGTAATSSGSFTLVTAR